MTRLFLASGAILAAVAAPAGGAGAAPVPPPPPCSFSLTGPVRSADSVTATVASTWCAAVAAPYLTVVCLRAGDGPVRCIQGRGAEPASVALPYEAEVTYSADGRGCAGWIGLPPAPSCQLLGPASATP